MRLCRRVRDRLEGETERGFTLVELMIVMIISLIMIVGMVGLMYMGFNAFKTNRDLHTITDSSRRMMQMMSRELRSALQFVNGVDCTGVRIQFYADIDADNPTASVLEGEYQDAEKITWYHDGSSSMKQTTKEPAGEGGGETTTTLGTGVDSVSFTYYRTGEKPGEAGVTPLDTETENINKEAGMVRIELDMSKGGVQRSFRQDVYLRASDRIPEGYYCAIVKVTPSTGNRGDNKTINIKGSNTHFADPGSVVYFTGGSAITLGSITVTGAETCSIDITVDGEAEYGKYDVNVVTGSEYPDALEDGFTVFDY